MKRYVVTEDLINEIDVNMDTRYADELREQFKKTEIIAWMTKKEDKDDDEESQIPFVPSEWTIMTGSPSDNLKNLAVRHWVLEYGGCVIDEMWLIRKCHIDGQHEAVGDHKSPGAI